MDLRAERNVLQRQAVARQDVDVVARHDRVAHLQPVRLEDVALLAIRVVQQRNARRAVRVVLDRRDLRRNVFLVALEVDHPVQPLVSAAAPPGGQVALVVAAPGVVQVLRQRPVRLIRRDLVEGERRLAAHTGRGRVVFANRHGLYAPCRKSGSFSPSRSFTYAFFQSERRPTYLPWRLNLPCASDVRTLSTFEPSSDSMAFLMSILLASIATWNTSVRPSSRRTVVFSVMSGRRSTLVSFIVHSRQPAAGSWQQLAVFCPLPAARRPLSEGL